MFVEREICMMSRSRCLVAAGYVGRLQLYCLTEAIASLGPKLQFSSAHKASLIPRLRTRPYGKPYVYATHDLSSVANPRSLNLTVKPFHRNVSDEASTSTMAHGDPVDRD
jgi:hypothetical protein